MSEHINVDHAFNPELRQAQSELDAYFETRPIEDQNGQIRRPDGTFYSKDRFNADMDAVRESHLYEATVSYEDLSMSELTSKLAEAEINDDKTIAGDVTDTILGKLSDLHEKNKTDRHEDGIESQDNMLDRVLRLKESKKQALLGKNGQSSLASSTTTPEVTPGTAIEIRGNDAEDAVSVPAPDTSNSASSAEQISSNEIAGFENKLQAMADEMAQTQDTEELMARLREFRETHAAYRQTMHENDASIPSALQYKSLIKLADIDKDAHNGMVDLIDQEEADSQQEDDEAREDKYFVRRSAENNEDDSKGRLKRFTGSLRSTAFKAGLIGAGAYAYLKRAPARSNQWINENMPESWSPLKKNIVKGVGGVVILGALAWAVKETAFDGNEVSAGDSNTLAGSELDMNLDSLIEMEGGTPEDAIIDTTDGLPEGIDQQAGAVGSDGEVTSVAPEVESPELADAEATGADELAGEGDHEEMTGGSSPETELSTDAMEVENGSGFIESLQENYNLSSEQAHEAYENMKSSLIGAEGTYTTGTDIRISSPGNFTLPEGAQKVLEEYLQSIDKM